MADKIANLLAKLPPKDLRVIQATIERIVSGNFEGMDIKAMKDHSGLYRVRAGSYRIVFRLTKENKVEVILIARRNERTYKDF